MPWIYHQRSGDLYHNDKYIGKGWSGHGVGKYNPALQSRPDVGPIPRGAYAISAPFNYQKTQAHPHGTGPYSMRLTPDPHNQMFGRAGFLIHGPSTNPQHYGQESNGCVILPLPLRHRVGVSNDHVLEVVQ